jgi:predicted RNase H-like nuclease (RuvC/YqgF family)
MKKIKQRKLTKGEQILYNDLSDALKEIKSLRGYNVNLSRQLNEIKIEKNREWDKKQKIIYTLMGRLRDEREEKEQLNKDFALYRKNVKELINEY